MVVLALMDPAGTAQRKMRLKRRIYCSKVQLVLYSQK